MVEINRENWYKLLTTKNDIEALIKELPLTPQNKDFFWANLLLLLQEQTDPLPASEEDSFDDIISSLFDFIQHYCDLYDIPNPDDINKIISKLYSEIKNDENGDYWNSSLQELIDFFVQKILGNSSIPLLAIYDQNGNLDKEHSIYISTLKQADAGYNFPIITYINKYDVIPYWNINNNSYDEIRKHDQIKNIIDNETKLQYTKEKLSKWLRLLMPRYGRRVEIEDLNRNFWVIGQTIAAISAYLFDDDSPIPKMLEGLLRETVELWENIFYLWLEAAAISQKYSKEVRTIVLPLPPRDNENRRHYDKIGESDNIIISANLSDGTWVITKNDNFEEILKKRLNYLIHQYSNENLCIIPFIRLKNYKHNYYNLEYYPVICFYNLSKREWQIEELKFYDDTGAVIFSPDYEKKKLSHLIYGTNQENEKLIWSYPYSNTPNIVNEDIRKFLYGNIRVVPHISASIQEDTLVINKGSYFSIEDAAAEMILQKKNVVAKCVINWDLTKKCYSVGWITHNPEIFMDDVLHYQNYNIGYNSYYMGETVSARQKTAAISYSDNLFNDEAYVLKIGNYLPTGGVFRMASVKVGQNQYNYTSMRGNVTKNFDGSTADTAYYRFDWNSYTGEHDGPSSKSIASSDTGCCFTNIEKKICTYPTEITLRYDGLLAVKKFIEVNASTTPTLYQSPAYFVTAVGLTPWQGGGRTGGDIYWDSAFIPGIYFYIPTSAALKEKETDSTENIDTTQYDKAYANMGDPLTFTVDNNTIKGDVKVNGNTVGKIISYNPVVRYEGYFVNYNDVASSVYKSSRWRQFFVVNSGTANKCLKVNINEGEHIYYQAKFSSKFEGLIKYFDVTTYNTITNKKSLSQESRCQVSEASVTIDEKYHQDKEGKIVDRSGGSIAEFNTIKNNKALDPNCTGFPMIVKNISGEYMEVEEDIYELISNLSSGNKNASTFHGNTSLKTKNGASYCKYTYISESSNS